MATANLGGLSVLVIDDVGRHADDLLLALENAGASVIGPVGHVDDAWDIVDLPEVDCAILDISRHGSEIFPVADVLLEHDVPVIFVTEHADEELPQRYLGLPVFRRPLSMEPLTRTIEQELRES